MKLPAYEIPHADEDLWGAGVVLQDDSSDWARLIYEHTGDWKRRRMAVLAFVRSHAGCCTADVARGLTISYSSATSHVEALREKGLLTCRREWSRVEWRAAQ
jgi:DNA-binding transcriptional ArsR family regulator